jgi:hypothetical protein
LAIHHGIVPIAIYRRRTIYSPERSTYTTPMATSPVSPTAPGQSAPGAGFTTIPLFRTVTDSSVMTMSSHHMFDLEQDQAVSAASIDRMIPSPMEVNIDPSSGTFPTEPLPQARRDSQATMTRLLESVNRVDNELPFVIANPLPDLVMDALDMLYILQPQP